MTTDEKDLCGMCNEPLRDGLGDGDLRPLGGVPSGLAHRECLLRSAVGGIGHILDHDYWCKGEGGDVDAGRTYRQSALEVDQWVHEHGVEAVPW